MYTHHADRHIVEEALAECQRWRDNRVLLAAGFDNQLRELALTRRLSHYHFWYLAPCAALKLGAIGVIAALGLGLVVAVLSDGYFGVWLGALAAIASWMVMLTAYLVMAFRAQPVRREAHAQGRLIRTRLKAYREHLETQTPGRPS